MKTKTIIIILVIVALLAAGIWIYAANKKQDTSEPESGSDTGSSVKMPLKQGSRGELVKMIQVALNKKYNSGLQTDGVWGKKTQAALLANNLPTIINQAEFLQITGVNMNGLAIADITSGKINPLNPLTWF